VSQTLPVRVLIVHPRDPAAPTLGGIQTFLRDFIKYAPAEFEITFVGTTRDEVARPVGRWMTLDLYGRKVKFLAVGTNAGVPRSPAAIARSIKGLARLWRTLAVDGRVLQVHRPYRSFVLNHHRGPIVQFIHLDLRDWPGPQGWPKLKGLYREFSDEELERMDRVYIVNESGALMLREQHPTMADRVEFLPVWFDATVFHPVDAADRERLRAELAERLCIRREARKFRFILSAGRLTEIKKPLMAIETLATLGDDRAHLVVAGSGELDADLTTRAAELGVSQRVHVLGDRPREEIAQLMQASDALLLTARSEGGGPRVVLEALACGLPVVSTSVVEIHRTVASGVNGWLVDEASPEPLADGLKWVFSQPHEELARAAAAAVAPFTAARMLEGLFADYRALSSPSVSK
jgi:glycosyltransferase involved in cell wall biosynthesis